MALARALEAGVALPQLSSSWAPFLIHASRFVKPGGRLAMVAPAELAHASYARPVVEFLRSAFGDVQILTFAQKLFPALSEDTVLVLASGRGEPFRGFSTIDLEGPAALAEFADPLSDLPKGLDVDASATHQGNLRLVHYLVPAVIRQLYRELLMSAGVLRLGAIADVGIGYVTGSNDFFHLDRAAVESLGLPHQFLRPAVRGGNQLKGLRFTRGDWDTLHQLGARNLLLQVPDDALPPALERYLELGVRNGVSNRYKCRMRKPWYHVPHVYEGDGFLTYMSGIVPKLVANEAETVAPNTLHIVRLHALEAWNLGALRLAALWQSSLTALSCELEGHHLGGGMLKLEPTEAEQVAIARSQLSRSRLLELADDLDALNRAGKTDEALQRADAIVLRQGLGISRLDVEKLRDGVTILRARRLRR